MELKECVYTRRSIRKFKPDPIGHEILVELMEGALMAPSGTNLQPWHFVVIESPEQMSRYMEIIDVNSVEFRDYLENRFPRNPKVVEDTIRFMATMGGAPVIVLAFLNDPILNDLEESHPTLQSVAAAIQTLLLLAWDKGIGSCWMTGALTLKVDGILQETFAPGKGRFVAAVALGYPAQKPKAPKRHSDRVVFI